MNKLSWLIYLMQVSENLSIGAMIFLIIGTVGATLAGLFCFLNSVFDDKREGWDTWVQIMTRAGAWILLVLFIVATMLPSRQTLTLIAASEIGEKLTNSDGVKSVVDPGLDLLKAWIRRETERLSAPK